MARNLPPDLVEKACNQCALQPTKTGSEPEWLRAVIGEISNLELKKALGVTFSNGFLSPRQLAILDGAKRGRDRSERNRFKKTKSQNPAGNNQQQIPPGMGQLD